MRLRQDIHQTKAPASFLNQALKTLNYQHIFALPFIENDFDLNQIQEGLASLPTV